MKKNTIIALVVVVIVIIAIVLFGRSGKNTGGDNMNTASNGTNGAAPIATSETTKVSSKTSEYKNDELGFSVQYPSAWEKAETDNGISFIMPIDQSQVSTVAKLQVDISTVAGKCAFPPVTTIKDRGTLVVGKNTLDMISMENSVQGRGYFNRMYSLKNGDVCYIFAFSSITQSLSSKGLTGSNQTQATNNNKAIVNSADTDFTNMVKSFAFVQGPAGVDETKAAPVK